MRTLGILLVATPIVLGVYAYVLYPALLILFGLVRRWRPPGRDPDVWPRISVTVPAFNEESSIARTIEGLLTLDYPSDRRQILVISDASTDRTDEIVRGFADRGVDLIRLPRRSGKTEAENAAGPFLTGDVVVNVDATVRILPGALKPLVHVFHDPSVGVASGQDVSVGDHGVEASAVESGYVDYEMWIRRLETRTGGIVGASGCYYAIRRTLYDSLFPAALSRDFASPLLARHAGFRSVSVDNARCLVPRTSSIRSEYRRKVRTMARGLETLWYQRGLLSPLRYGAFAWKLASHKLGRWLAFGTAPLALVGLALLVPSAPLAWLGLVGAGLGTAVGLLGWHWPGRAPPPMLIGAAAFLLSATVAAVVAWGKAIRGELNPIWEPTRRPT